MKNLKLILTVFLLLFLGFFALVACGGTDNFDLDEDVTHQDKSDGMDGVDTAVFQKNICPFEINKQCDVECGTLTVPENRATGSSATIDLAVAILTPSNFTIDDPIIYLAGGPGSSALNDFTAGPEAWVSYPCTQDRPFIFLDQRGTGYSQPSLDCYELNDNNHDDPERDCYQRLVNEGIDLSGYNTIENAHDVADLMQALNYNEYNVLSISYGTRLALTLMRERPENIRSVILDSPFPPNAATPIDESVNMWQAIQVLSASCAHDPDCNDAFPELENVLISTVTNLNNNPEGDITGDYLLQIVVAGLMAGAQVAPRLPLMIYEAADGNFDLLDEIAENTGYCRICQEDVDVSDSEGMYNTIICHDEFSFHTYDQAAAEAQANIPAALQKGLFATTKNRFNICDYWNVGIAPARENQAVVSNIPTLILVGELDPTTPPRWAQLAAQTLPNSYLFEIHGAGHSLLSTNSCAISMAHEFYTAPARKPSEDCLNSAETLHFELP